MITKLQRILYVYKNSFKCSLNNTDFDLWNAFMTGEFC